MSSASIDDLLKEDRSFPPSSDFQQKAKCNDPAIYEKAEKDPEGYWEDWAKQLHWFEPWKQVLKWEPPHAEWFLGGKINACYNCVDRHVVNLDGTENHRKNKKAIIFEGEQGETTSLTYGELLIEVSKFANVLKGLGVGK